MEKRCSKCGQEKPLEDFPKHKGGKYGRKSICKDCQKKYNKKWREENRERISQKSKEWYENGGKELAIARYAQNKQDPQWVEKERVRSQEKNRRVRESLPPGAWAEYQRQYRERNIDRVRERTLAYDRAWRAAHRNHVRARNVVRKALRKSTGQLSAAEWESICKKYDYRCLCCGQVKPLTIDHIVPITKGGLTTVDNIQPLCLSCNSKKKQKTIDYRPLDHIEDTHEHL